MINSSVPSPAVVGKKRQDRGCNDFFCKVGLLSTGRKHHHQHQAHESHSQALACFASPRLTGVGFSWLATTTPGRRPPSLPAAGPPAAATCPCPILRLSTILPACAAPDDGESRTAGARPDWGVARCPEPGLSSGCEGDGGTNIAGRSPACLLALASLRSALVEFSRPVTSDRTLRVVQALRGRGTQQDAAQGVDAAAALFRACFLACSLVCLFLSLTR